MENSIKRNELRQLLSLVLIFVMLFLFCSCGNQKLSGTYSDNLGFSTLEFKKGKVTLITPVRTTSGTYKMDGDSVVISYDDGKSDTLIYNEDDDTLSLYGVFTYSKED